MSNIVQFPQRGHVEINCGVVQSTTITDERGTRPLHTLVGEHRFFVDVVEAGGTRIGMWDGATHQEAIAEARILSTDFGPVRDLAMSGGPA